jgi:hypothetical protein
VVKNAKTKVPFSQLKQRAPKLQKQHSILFSTVPSRDQVSGKKIITDDDIDDKAGDEEYDASTPSASSSSSSSAAAAADTDDKDDKDDDDDSGSSTKKKAVPKKKRACKYGANCFRVNPDHLEVRSSSLNTWIAQPTN